jgi:hypothetical protein
MHLNAVSLQKSEEWVRKVAKKGARAGCIFFVEKISGATAWSVAVVSIFGTGVMWSSTIMGWRVWRP